MLALNSVRLAALLGLLALPLYAGAGNGIFTIGSGLPSKGMGGVGAAAPLTATDAISQNPAGLTRHRGFTLDVGLGFFTPDIAGEVNAPLQLRGKASEGPFLLPAFAVSYQVGPIYAGLGAIANAGFGANYSNTALRLFGGAPPANTDINVFFGSFKISPTIAYRVSDAFSIGGALDINNNSLDFGVGLANEYAYGISAGATYKPSELVTLGLSYTSRQGATMKNVIFDGATGRFADFKLEAPAVLRLGVALEPSENLIIEADYKRIQNADAAGLKDLDARNQDVFAFGVQYLPRSDIVLRAGFNYGKNPFPGHTGWNPAGMSNLQGVALPTASVEYLRTLGLPIVYEKHLTLGVAYRFANMELALAYEHAFEKKVVSQSAGGALQFGVKTSQNNITLGVGFKF